MPAISKRQRGSLLIKSPDSFRLSRPSALTLNCFPAQRHSRKHHRSRQRETRHHRVGKRDGHRLRVQTWVRSNVFVNFARADGCASAGRKVCPSVVLMGCCEERNEKESKAVSLAENCTVKPIEFYKSVLTRRQMVTKFWAKHWSTRFVEFIVLP